VVELVDTHALGACASRREGSSPFIRTITLYIYIYIYGFFSELSPAIWRLFNCYENIIDYTKTPMLQSRQGK